MYYRKWEKIRRWYPFCHGTEGLFIGVLCSGRTSGGFVTDDFLWMGRNSGGFFTCFLWMGRNSGVFVTCFPLNGAHFWRFCYVFSFEWGALLAFLLRVFLWMGRTSSGFVADTFLWTHLKKTITGKQINCTTLPKILYKVRVLFCQSPSDCTRLGIIELPTSAIVASLIVNCVQANIDMNMHFSVNIFSWYLCLSTKNLFPSIFYLHSDT